MVRAGTVVGSAYVAQSPLRVDLWTRHPGRRDRCPLDEATTASSRGRMVRYERVCVHSHERLHHFAKWIHHFAHSGRISESQYLSNQR